MTTLADRIKAAQQPAPKPPVQSEWVKRALEKRLPAKSMS